LRIDRVADIEDEAADAIAGLKLLAGDLLRPGHEALRPIDLDDQGAALVSLGHAGDELALSLRELVEEAVALVLAELLNHHLLGGLGRNATKLLQRDELLGALFGVAPQGDLAAQAIHLTAELLGVERVEVLAGRADHRLLEIVDQELAIDVPVAGDGVKDAKGFGVHGVRTGLGMWVGMSGCGTRSNGQF
jgi:hypothetical protein